MPTVYFVHGFNVRDGGDGTVGKLMPSFEEMGMSSKLFSYGWIGPMGVWFLNPRIVKQLIPLIQEGDCGVAHSNGCVVLLMASIYGAPFSSFIFINPALDSNIIQAPKHVKKILVIHNEGDYPVQMAAWLRALMPWAQIGDALWGDMGARGYQPGPYVTSGYVPERKLSKFIHAVNVFCLANPIVLTVLRVLIGVPLFISYLLFLAPIEVLLTFVFNNVFGKEKGMALSVLRTEDRQFILTALVLPIFIWLCLISFW